MPHSLRVRLKNLQRKGELTEKDIDRIFKALSQEPTIGQLFSCEEVEELRSKIWKQVEQEPCDDVVSREAVIKDFTQWRGKLAYTVGEDYSGVSLLDTAIRVIKGMPSVTQKSGWISVSERLPEDTYPVNITWVNHDPEPYYATIKDKPFTATGCYCDGKWYWYSVTCQDYLDEYGRCDVDAMDDDIEVIAWMSLPKPYEPQESEEQTE